MKRKRDRLKCVVCEKVMQLIKAEGYNRKGKEHTYIPLGHFCKHCKTVELFHGYKVRKWQLKQ